MIKTRTAKKFLAAATFGVVALTGFAGAAGADTIAPAPQPHPGGVIANPAPQPQPDPPAPEPELPIAQPEPGVDPAPDFPIAQPAPGGDPEPFDPPIAQPQPDPDPQPEGPDEIGADLGCTFTHGCDDDGSIDDITSAGTDVDGDGCIEIIGGPETCPADQPGDTPGDTPGDDDTPKDEPGDEDRGQLPHTGAGVLAVAAAGMALTAGGLAAKKAAKRS